MWVSDGSSEISIDGNKVICTVNETSGGNVYNAIWKGDENGLVAGKGYWRLICENMENALFAGVTDLNKFKSGWACKGLFFGGNLSDGGGLLVGNFGPRLKERDVLGIFVDVDDAKIKVYFDVNGRSLGLAFAVPRSTLTAVFPAVHFSGCGTVSIQKSEAFPTTIREEEKFEGLQGHWKYATGPFQSSDQSLTMEISKSARQPNSYRGSLRVLNTISISFNPEPSAQGHYRGLVGATTLMGGPPQLMQLEEVMTQHLAGVFNINQQGQLSIRNGNQSSLWVRFTPALSPVTDDPFQ